MEITLSHALIGLAISGFLLVILVFVALRSGRATHPVRCAHCWSKKGKETVICVAEQKGLWGICPDCIDHYWKFDVPPGENPAARNQRQDTGREMPNKSEAGI